MNTSTRWFPASLQNRAAWFRNFANQFAELASTLGFLPAQITAVNNDNADVQFAASATVEINAYVRAFRQYRDVLANGNIGEPTPIFPSNPALAPPSLVATGINERLMDLVRRIRASPAYTSEIGAALGILSTAPAPTPPENLRPVLKVMSLPGSVIRASFVKGKTDGVVIEMKLDNAAEWTEAGRFFKSPALITIPQNAQSLPRGVQLRARYVEGNTPVGQLSDIVTTATQPQG